MDDESIKRLRDSLDGPSSQIQKALAEHEVKNASIHSLAKLIANNPEMIAGPARQLGQYLVGIDKQREMFANSLNTGTIRKFAEDMDALQKSIASAAMKVGLASQTIASYTNRVVLPKLAIADQFANGINQSLQNILREYDVRLPGIQQAMVAMQNPWIDALDAERSIRGFSELKIIGRALNAVPSFDSEFSSLLRLDLGDWRDPVTVPHDAYANPPARTETYVEHGLNTELTDFPDAAFEESLAVTGIKGDSPALIALYGSPFPEPDDKEGHTRNLYAYDWLFRFETQIRKFISQILAAEFGERWEKQQVPGTMRESWKEKRAKAESQGETLGPLIAYADFTDYIQLIIKKDHWPLFAPYFGRLEDVRESFQRLFPFRLGTMHSRIITKEDQLMLFVETRRLMNAILKPR